MSLSFREELSFSDIYESIGKPKSPEQKRIAATQVCERDRVADLRQAQLERNIHRLPVPETKLELEKVKSDVTSDLEIIETQNDPEDIDILYRSQAYEGRLCPYSKLI